MKRLSHCLAALLLIVVASRGASAQPPARSVGKLTFEVLFTAAARKDAADGRAFVMISKTPAPEPRLQTEDYRGTTPFFGADVEGLKPGQTAIVDDKADGYPLDRISDIPPGDYYVQGMLNVYMTFYRSDGHVLKMHMDQWEGQHFQASPGNLFSEPKMIHLDPASTQVVKITLDKVIPPITAIPDTDSVKHIKFQSPLLTAFWGQPIYVGATVALPSGYDDSKGVYYPVNYEQGHFSTAAPGNLGHTIEVPEGASDSQKERIKDLTALGEAWRTARFPRMIYVTFQHPTPYYDDSYAVDSPNTGPYGRAVTEELIPYIESHFRAIPKPYARFLSGGSTGGWEALALQIFNPDYFGGCFAYCPDPVDFHFFQIVNIYEWPNAWFKHDAWIDVPIPGDRDINGMVVTTMKQQLNYERALGSHGRSGEQWDVWQAVYGPIGDDGYFKPLFDPRTGAIDKDVAAYWRDHMDLTQYLKTHWTEIGPRLAGKIHIWVGDMDTYYLNDAVHEMEKFLSTTSNPAWGGSIVYGVRKPHCWTGPLSPAEQITNMAQEIASHAPPDADTSWWRY